MRHTPENWCSIQCATAYYVALSIGKSGVTFVDELPIKRSSLQLIESRREREGEQKWCR
jgi:hypothetical protein